MPDQPLPKEPTTKPGQHPEPHHDVPPHVFRELMELREKVGRLEGMMELFLKQIEK